ncbi:thioesterase domain-containing protein [Amycolatopsis sp. NPDC059657]|uniref:non-ribosomal peptide synthetase n=1 Tax=Amycolatopsis sp. NPDC059657 TaxID=3346899 RepID=UPI003670EC01
MITPGYRDNPDANAASFTEDGWFRTGDLGSMRDGRLTLAGRSKDSIVVNGVNYYSHDLEAVITALPGVEPSFVAAFAIRPPGSDTEELVVAFAADAADETALYRVVTAVRDRAAQHWGFRPALVLPLPQEEFPKTSLGKIQRPLMRRNLESGVYAEHEFAVADLVRRKLGGYTAPEGPTEEILAEVYGQVFGLDPATVSATASFFDLGGTSIDVLRLRRLVEQRLPGTEVTVPQLFGAPTVRLLATRVDAAGDLPYDPIVPLQTSGSGTPLFCVHPAGAEVLVFVALAKHFTGERPFYALRFRGFGAAEEPFGSWDEMVGCYVDAIRRTQPEGPYALTGYSLGGAIAFDVAKRLEAAGERVDFYCSIDLPPHIPDIDVFDFACTATNLALFVGLTNVEQLETLPPVLRGLSHEDQLAHLIGLASPARLAELDLDLAQFSEWVHIAHALVTAAKTYEPTDTVEGVTVLYASPLRWTKEDWSARIHRWDEHSRTPVRYRRVPGEHHTLLGPEFVAAFHQVLDAELKRALGED